MTTPAEQTVIDLAKALSADAEGSSSKGIYRVLGQDLDALDEALEALQAEGEQQAEPKPRTFLVHFSFQGASNSGVGNTFITDRSGLPTSVDMIKYWQDAAIPNSTRGLHNILVLGFTELEG